MFAIIVAIAVASSWLYNLYCWMHGISYAAYAARKQPGVKFTERFLGFWKHIAYTVLDIGCVFVVRFLIGSYAASMLPASIMAVAISWFLLELRHGRRSFIPKDKKESTDD